MEFQIRKAISTEYDIVRSFYYTLIDEMQEKEYKPGWEKGVYPTDEYLKGSIEKGELYLGFSENHIAAAMIMNHSGNESYANIQWPTAAADNEITVIHALGVHPLFSNKGYAKAMVHYVLHQAQQSSQKVIRLDVLSGNLPAKRLYEVMGFQYIGTIPMFYEDTGWTDFLLYEYVLQNRNAK